MNRALSYLPILAVIAGLALIHFSLVQAQEEPPPEPTNTPTPTPTPTPTRPPASASMNRSSGGVETSVLVTGQNFDPGESITINFGGQDVATTTASDSGSFSVTFDVPSLEAGSYPVQAGSVSVGSFTITST
ncbi:MAG TPA: hypothetical protein VFA32_03650, partial [Dehalococcoidia bacterium]|nr:hypothetical protein [Dehalococcoidia bacterium]